MDFERDEAKRLADILKHGIDFVDPPAIVAGPIRETDDLRGDHGEAAIAVLRALVESGKHR
jgi:uncharacterized DUF497 family protein